MHQWMLFPPVGEQSILLAVRSDENLRYTMPSNVQPKEGQAAIAGIEDVQQAAHELFAEPEQWLNTPNEHLGGEAPADLIAQGKADPVRNLLDSIRHGMFS